VLDSEEPTQSREFNLLLACCHWPQNLEIVRQRATAEIDWPLVVSLIQRHRVTGLVASALSQAGVACPLGVAAHLQDRAAEAAAGSLVLAAEAVRLNANLKTDGLTPYFIKGSTLGFLAYGSLALKESCDIDLLISPSEAFQAAEILRKNGYSPVVGDQALDEAQLLTSMIRLKDTMWHHDKKRTTVELHTRLFANPTMLPVDWATKPDCVAVGREVTLPSLERKFLLVYLSVHGATHAWSRLKWLADFAALVNVTSAADQQEALVLARKLEVHRAFAGAMILASELLNAHIDGAILAAARRVEKVRSLERIALRAMVGSGNRELDAQALGTLGIHAAHFFLVPGLRHKWAEFRSKLEHPTDFLEPRKHSNFFLKATTALPRWLMRRFRQRSGA
jgi:hypothetical protein